ncbi:MAG TPA: PA14 domain-containing protein [Tepidisphaeraceae bacterium]|nr:PA14 domain-containing protein [Tepidisphaeraceae bacterium]
MNRLIANRKSTVSPSATCAVESLEGRELMSVSGLQAQYYDWSNFKQLKVTRTDAAIDFNWGKAAPDASMATNKFSVRWQGKVEAPASGLYQFHVSANDNVRLRVDGEQLVNRWQDTGMHKASGQIFLEAGQKYDVRMEYREVRLHAHAKLEWTPPGSERAVVPTSALSSDAVAAPPPVVGSPVPAPTQPAGQLVTNFTLINADTDRPIEGYDLLAQGATLSYATLPTHRLNVRANVAGEVAQVTFALNGQEVRTELAAPFALGADAEGNYYSWTPSPGTYTLTATPYTTVGGSLTAGAVTTVSFTVVA